MRDYYESVVFIKLKTTIMEEKPFKFRFWNRVLCIMSDSYLLEDLFKQQIPFVDVEFMQFTGLIDKNGKEIYEGDILSDDGYTNKVEWNFRASCSCCNEASGYYWSYGEAEYLEVVGNIYENPELLKR